METSGEWNCLGGELVGQKHFPWRFQPIVDYQK